MKIKEKSQVPMKHFDYNFIFIVIRDSEHLWHSALYWKLLIKKFDFFILFSSAGSICTVHFSVNYKAKLAL